MSPLVSVLMPCYNSARTLPMALGSLLAQTYENWECVIVDDGSTDHPGRIVSVSKDPRIRYSPLDRHSGGGVARQVTLDQARGDLIAMLDADDWIYPQKLERQICEMASNPDLSVLSTAMAIVDKDQQLRRVRRYKVSKHAQLMQGPLKQLRLPPVAFGPSMMRATLAKQFRFAPDLMFGQDSDYLARMMLGRHYGVLPDVLYAYSEYGSASLNKTMQSYPYLRLIYRRFRPQFPVASRLGALSTYVKAMGNWGLDNLGLWEWSMARRSGTPTVDDQNDLAAALKVVRAATERSFSSELLSQCGSSL